MSQVEIDRRRLLRRGGLACFAWTASGLASPDWASASNGPLEKISIVNPQSDFHKTLQELLRSGGYLEAFGLDAEIVNVSDTSKIMAALIGGDADICCGSGFGSVFPAIERGAAVKIIGGAELAQLTVLFSKKPEIRSARDLVGRSVGAGAPGSLLYELVVALLQKEGVDYRSVNFVNVGGSPDVFKAVVAGAVDAGPGEIGYTAKLDEYGVHVLRDGWFADELPLFTNQAFLASDAAISTKRRILARVLAAHAKLFRFLSTPQSEDAWVRARAKALGADRRAEALTQWRFLQHPHRLDVDLLLSDDQMTFVQRLNVELGVQKTVLPARRTTDLSIARDALKLLG